MKKKVWEVLGVVIESVKVVIKKFVKKLFYVEIDVLLDVFVIFVFERFDLLNVFMLDFGYIDIKNLFSFD